MLFALTAALLDASISAWDTKYQYVSVRPITGAVPQALKSCDRARCSSVQHTGGLGLTVLWLWVPGQPSATCTMASRWAQHARSEPFWCMHAFLVVAVVLLDDAAWHRADC